MCRGVVLALTLAACRLHFDELGDAGGQDSLGAFSAPQPIPGANTGADEQDPVMTSNGRELTFSLVAAQKDLYVMQRDAGGGFSAPVPVTFDDPAGDDAAPRLSPDDLTLWFGSTRAGSAAEDVWTTTRTAIGGVWTAPVQFAQVNSPQVENWLSICGDGHYVLVRELALFEGVLGGAAPQPIAELNVSGYESGALLMADCTTLYFSSEQAGDRDLYVAHRAAPVAPWQPAQPLTELNVAGADEEDPWLSADERTVIFASSRAGSFDLYIATR